MSLYFSLSSTQKLGDIRFRVPADEVYADTRNGPISTALGKKQKYETDQQTDIARQWCYTHHWFPDGSNSWANWLWPIAVPRCFPKKTLSTSHLWEWPQRVNCGRICVLCLILNSAGTSLISQPRLEMSQWDGRKEHMKQVHQRKSSKNCVIFSWNGELIFAASLKCWWEGGSGREDL